MPSTLLAPEPKPFVSARAADQFDKLGRLNEHIWSVVVIGAGPAGAVAAHQLAGLTDSVLLVDRKPVPRSKVCGACINDFAVSELRRIGLLHVIQGDDSVALHALQLWGGTSRVQIPLPGGVVMARDRFDAALVGAAIEAGAQVLPETVAIVGNASDSLRTVMLRHASNTIEVRARVVVVADGLGRPSLAGHPEFRMVSRNGSRIGSGCVVRASACNLAPGVIAMAVGRMGYVGMVRLADGQINVAAALDPKSVADCGGLGQAAEQVIAESGMPSPARLADECWRGTPLLTQRPLSVAGHRLFIVGDAAGYVEPFTGDGIAAALRSATAVVPLADAGSRNWTDSLNQTWAQTHRQRVVRGQIACRALAWSLRHPTLVRSAMPALSRVPSWLEWFAANISSPTPHGRT